MRYARVTLPGGTAPLRGAVTADGAALDLGGSQVAIPDGAVAPAVDGWIYGPLLNEHSTLERFGPQLTEKPYAAPPKAPVLYFKPKNTHVGHQARIALPAYAERVELGASLGLVFGRQTSRPTVESALDNVVGLTLVLDLSVPNASVYRPPIQEKCWDGACPVGPWVVDKADLGDPQAIVIRTYVNGRLVAERSHADMVRPPAQLVADVTEFMTLSADDVLLLGYPVGAVPTAGRGDHILIQADGLGSLECTLTGDLP